MQHPMEHRHKVYPLAWPSLHLTIGGDWIGLVVELGGAIPMDGGLLLARGAFGFVDGLSTSGATI